MFKVSLDLIFIKFNRNFLQYWKNFCFLNLILRIKAQTYTEVNYNTYLRPKPTRVAKAHLDLYICKNIRRVYGVFDPFNKPSFYFEHRNMCCRFIVLYMIC